MTSNANRYGVNPDQLVDAGRRFLAAANMRPGDVDVAPRTRGGFDDLTEPRVHVVSTMTYSERARRFGVDGRASPTAAWLDDVVRVYGDAPEVRTLTTAPYWRAGGTAAVNRAGADLDKLLTQGGFRLA